MMREVVRLGTKVYFDDLAPPIKYAYSHDLSFYREQKRSFRKKKRLLTFSRIQCELFCEVANDKSRVVRVPKI